MDKANPLWNPWANDSKLIELYRKRCRDEIEEMTCAAQAAEILAPLIKHNETLLDAGCGGGYYYWSFFKRNIPLDYYGLDYTPEMVELARTEMCLRTNLTDDRFSLGSIENLEIEYDNILCFHVLTNAPHYALPLERLLSCTKKRLLIRENMGSELEIRYSPDQYLDPGKRHINVYHNRYPLEEVKDFISRYNFRVTQITDRRTNDGVEMVCDIPHQWRILLAERE